MKAEEKALENKLQERIKLFPDRTKDAFPKFEELYSLAWNDALDWRDTAGIQFRDKELAEMGGEFDEKRILDFASHLNEEMWSKLGRLQVLVDVARFQHSQDSLKIAQLQQEVEQLQIENHDLKNHSPVEALRALRESDKAKLAAGHEREKVLRQGLFQVAIRLDDHVAEIDIEESKEIIKKALSQVSEVKDEQG